MQQRFPGSTNETWGWGMKAPYCCWFICFDVYVNICIYILEVDIGGYVYIYIWLVMKSGCKLSVGDNFYDGYYYVLILQIVIKLMKIQSVGRTGLCDC